MTGLVFLSPEAKARFAQTTRSELDLLTPEELAAALELQVATLAEWRGKDQGPNYIKLGKGVFYRRKDVAAWVEFNVVALHTSTTAQSEAA